VYARFGDVPATLIVAIALLAIVRRRMQPNGMKF
jgi:apolipoprotein N-acyltransferase